MDGASEFSIQLLRTNFKTDNFSSQQAIGSYVVYKRRA